MFSNSKYFEPLTVNEFENFISKYFSESSFLVDSIKEYHRVHKQKKDEASIYDLLKNKQ